MTAVPQETAKELQEAFFLFDYDKDGKITTREVGAAVRSVGLNPTEAELKDMINDVTAMGGKVDVSNLCQIIGRRLPQPKSSPTDLRDAFEVFDRQGNGMVFVSDLKHSLTTLGERLTDEELDELVREVDQDGEGQVNFDEMIKVLLAK
ncbi:hypothetical protein CAPTEDRAFT_18677 [Capitella teleta]|uniref:EF-hand domain-containing protein n=1 Tax=Capitella teleta TaxID=283909 RepID=R7VDS8_CAPTE|nr:hypothetical protein CAPTEDRAFT_18677 [Capitella teleta]|eukprot:ELU13835.1 hypothetical protein CAPTEDRAFT_18677 [Capitella teleta]